MGEACGTHGRDRGCIQNFGWRKEFRRSRRTEGSVLKRGVKKYTVWVSGTGSCTSGGDELRVGFGAVMNHGFHQRRVII